MRFKKVIKLFERGSVCVFGTRGSGKDLISANVAVRRKLTYVANVDYGGDHIDYHYEDFDINNTFRNFVSGHVNYYKYPFPDGTDLYLSDTGAYFPSQYCSELNKLYPSLPITFALSRHLGLFSIHTNSQYLGRVWDKLREQSEIFVYCRRCFYICDFVFQWIRIYDKYDAALEKREPLKLPVPLFASRDYKLKARLAYAEYKAAHGSIKNGFLLYRNKSSYDTRFFKTLLEGGEGREAT